MSLLKNKIGKTSLIGKKSEKGSSKNIQLPVKISVTKFEFEIPDIQVGDNKVKCKAQIIRGDRKVSTQVYDAASGKRHGSTIWQVKIEDHKQFDQTCKFVFDQI